MTCTGFSVHSHVINIIKLDYLYCRKDNEYVVSKKALKFTEMCVLTDHGKYYFEFNLIRGNLQKGLVKRHFLNKPPKFVQLTPEIITMP